MPQPVSLCPFKKFDNCHEFGTDDHEGYMYVLENTTVAGFPTLSGGCSEQTNKWTKPHRVFRNYAKASVSMTYCFNKNPQEKPGTCSSVTDAVAFAAPWPRFGECVLA